MQKNIVGVALLLAFFNCYAGKTVIDGGDHLVLSMLVRSNNPNDFIVTFHNEKKELVDAEIPKNKVDMRIAPFNQVSLIEIRKKIVNEKEAAVTYLYKKKEGKWVAEQFDKEKEVESEISNEVETAKQKRKCIIL